MVPSVWGAGLGSTGAPSPRPPADKPHQPDVCRRARRISPARDHGAYFIHVGGHQGPRRTQGSTMQGTTGVRAGNRLRVALAPAASALVLALALGGCTAGSLRTTSAAPGSTSPVAQPAVQTPTDTPSEPDAAASGPIPTVTADPLTPVTPAPTTPTATATGDTPPTVTPVTAPGT